MQRFETLPQGKSLSGRSLSSSGGAPPPTLVVPGSPGRLLHERSTSGGQLVLTPEFLEGAPPCVEEVVLASTTTTGQASALFDFRSVVKVFATTQEPDYVNPWQTQMVRKGTGSGVAFENGAGRQILTAAHVVAHHTFVQVQRTGVETPDKYVAQVAAVWHECDLAILEVEDSEFWKGLSPAPLGRMPEIRSIVLVAGFPIGGGELSITEGVVSRIEGQMYSHSRRRLLAITIDAAINPGNSGGPVFNTQGEFVGIAFQQMEMASNVGHVIPSPVIEHFLNGVKKSGPRNYRGFPGTGFEKQDLALENPYVRKHHNLDHDVRGIRISKILFGQTCDGVLEPGDVITHVNDQAVANNGTLSYGEYGRVSIEIAFTMVQVGSPIELQIVRDGKRMTVTATARPYQRLVPLQFQNKRPPYFVYCGLVFQPLSLDYINYTNAENPNFVSLYFLGRQKKDWRRAVVLSQVLSDNVNVGYEALVSEKIMKVNGENVVDLTDLVQKVESTTEPTVTFATCCDDAIILPSPANPEAQIANERIQSRYALGSDRYLEEEVM